MRRHTAPRRAAFALLAAAVFAVSMVACGGSVTPTPLSPTVATITTLPSNDEMLSEKIIGSPSAPITLIEYLSLATTPSKDFYLTGDGVQIKTQFADTGRAQIFFRNLFITGEPVTGGMLARCAGNAKFFDATTAFFQNQATWTTAADPSAAEQQLMLGFGMSQSVINACIGNATLQNALSLTQSSALGATYTLPDGTQRTPALSTSGTSIITVPAVVVNGVLFDGRNNDGTVNAAFAPTVANIQPFLK